MTTRSGASERDREPGEDGSPVRRRPRRRSGVRARAAAARTARSRRARRAPPGATSHLPRNEHHNANSPGRGATGHPKEEMSRRRGAFRGALDRSAARRFLRLARDISRRTSQRQNSSASSGLGDVEALGLVASEVAEPVEGVAILDALGDDAEPEVLPELDRRSHDREVVDAVEHVRHERTVDLDLLDRESLQVGERGEPRAEVIDREAHPDLRQVVQDGVGAPESATRKLSVSSSFRKSWRHVPAIEEPADDLGQVLIEQRSRGQVDGDRDADPVVGPRRQVCSTSFNAQWVSGCRSTVFSTIGMKSAGTSRPSVGMVPADQRLGARDSPVGRVGPSAGGTSGTARRRSRAGPG